MKRILIVIDMQNDFIDGALGTKEAVQIVENVKSKIQEYPIENVYYTLDTHGLDYLKTQEGENLPVEHCIKGTRGWELSPELSVLLSDAKCFEKPTFGSIALAEELVQIAEEDEIEIEMIGLCTDICVVSNALLIKAFLPETKISVLENCCAGVTPEAHEAALATMQSCQICIVR